LIIFFCFFDLVFIYKMSAKSKKLLGFIIIFSLITSLCTTITTFINEMISNLPIHSTNKYIMQIVYIAIYLIILFLLVSYVFNDFDTTTLF
jgi:hypothetical protein